ncbi:low affinity iron permease family protein [Sphingobacterium sp.]|uniref:low affinity iron permease family protein n=1 Tax=Sphingobacterium sp. TaxID=341027 RepID=UPI002FDE0F53
MKKKKNLFERFSDWATRATGSSAAFIIATSTVIIWAVSGPLFNYSETWQLVINTGTTIVTFLMVFLIQKSQNKDSKAVHLKLNELIASHKGTSNRMVNLEDLSEEELDQLAKFYAHIAKLALQESDITCTHSIDAAEENHDFKMIARKEKKDRLDDEESTNTNNNH